MNHWLVPIRQRWAEMILDGVKTVEVRRRRAGNPPWAPGDRFWLYVVAPVQRVAGVARVSRCLTGAAVHMHPHIGGSCLSDGEYWRYARRNLDLITLAWLEVPSRLPEPLALDALGIAHPPRSIRALPAEAVRVLEAA